MMADHLVVVGRGRLIASGDMQGFISTSQRNAVVVRADDNGRLGQALYDQRANVQREEDRLVVTGLDLDRVSTTAFELGVRVIELFRRDATLEEAFLEATGASEEFRASMGIGGPAGGTPPGGMPPGGMPPGGMPPGHGGPPPGGPPPGMPPQPGPYGPQQGGRA